MDPTSVLSRLGPGRPGLRIVSGPRGWLAAREDLVDDLLALGLGPDGEPRLQTSDLVGKRPLEGIVVKGEELVVRRYHHGGLLRWLTGARFSSAERPFVELCLQRELEARGPIRSPEVVAARAVRARPWGWSLAVVTRRVPGALDLGQALAERRDKRLSTAAWRALVEAVGRLVGRLHEVGFLHADLTPRNLIVDRASLERGEPRLWVLDLDRSRWIDALGEEQRRDNLARLGRHLRRLEAERGLELQRTDVARFLRAWQPEPGARRAAWRALVKRAGEARGVHATGWWLERVFGRGRSNAEGHLGGPSDG